MITVWGRVNSINVMKVLWCLAELDLEFERIDAGMEHGVVGEAEYLALNPNGRVPTLRDGAFTLWESNVIVRYLAAKYGAGRLLPEDLEARFRAEQWMDWQQTTLVPEITTIFWAKVRGRETSPEAISAAEQRIAGLWSMVDAALAGHDFMLGDSLSVADIVVGACAWRWYAMDTERPRLANVERWHASLQSRAAFREYVALPLR